MGLISSPLSKHEAFRPRHPIVGHPLVTTLSWGSFLDNETLLSVILDKETLYLVGLGQGHQLVGHSRERTPSCYPMSILGQWHLLVGHWWKITPSGFVIFNTDKPFVSHPSGVTPSCWSQLLAIVEKFRPIGGHHWALTPLCTISLTNDRLLWISHPGAMSSSDRSSCSAGDAFVFDVSVSFFVLAILVCWHLQSSHLERLLSKLYVSDGPDVLPTE